MTQVTFSKTQVVLNKLSLPFPTSEVEWRLGSTNKEKKRGMALAYIDARAVMDRLDFVVGGENWQRFHEVTVTGSSVSSIECNLKIKLNDEWVTKSDAAEQTDIEAIKGGRSDAFKRAAVNWGIGRYLYNIKSEWVDVNVVGSKVYLPDAAKNSLNTILRRETARIISNLQWNAYTNESEREGYSKLQSKLLEAGTFDKKNEILKSLGFNSENPDNNTGMMKEIMIGNIVLYKAIVELLKS